jgi:PAS domain S-box-containing protein
MKKTRKTKAELLAEIEMLTSRLERFSAESAKKEHALQSATLRLRLMANSLPALVAYVNAEQRYEYVNIAYEEWFGITLDDAVGRHIRDVIGEKAYESVRSHVEAALAGEPVSYQVVHSHLQKGLRTNLTKLVPHAGPDGVEGFYVLSIDITERIEAEEALKRSEQKMRLITDALPVLISYVDSNQCYKFSNKTYETWLGCPRSDAYGKHMSEVLGDNAYQALRKHVDTALSGIPVTFEGVIPYQAGPRYVRGTYVPDIEDGTVRGFFALIEDISKEKENEKNLQRAKRSLEEAQQIAHIGNWNWDIVGNELSWSDEVYRIFGLTPQQFGATYEAFLEFVHPEDRNRAQHQAYQGRECAMPAMPQGRDLRHKRSPLSPERRRERRTHQIQSR